MIKSSAIKILNSFNLKVCAKQLIVIDHIDDIKNLNNQNCKNFFIIGEATNLIMNEYYDGSIIKVAIDDIVKIDNQTLSIGAGLNWFKLIDYCLNHKFYGIENLTSIPGTVGAAPVQNIGAYGVEISSFVDSVTCYDFDTKQIQVMSNKECKFNYRESIFQLKNSLILRVNLKFSKEFSPILSYPSLSDYIVTNNINPSSITPKALSNLIKTIREFKLPDPSTYPNVGSIFKNPIVKTNSIDSDFLSGHKWKVSTGLIKLSAAKLIELIIDKISIPPTLAIYENHSLVIINLGDATYSELKNLISDIQNLVKLSFNINLEIEPKIL